MPRRKCVFNANLQKLYPFLQKTLSARDVKCRKCNAVFSIANSGRSTIEQHLSSVKHQSADSASISTLDKVERRKFKIQKLPEVKVEDLINHVKLKPGLYERKSNLYQRQDWKDKAWEEIADELHEDETVCKSAWRSLREQFNRVVKEIKGSSTKEEADQQRLKYKYFENLLFLDDTIEPKLVTCKLDNEEAEVDNINLEDNMEDGLWSEIHVSPKRSPNSWENDSEEVDSLSSISISPLTGTAKRNKAQDNEDPFQGFPSQAMLQFGKNDVDGVDYFFLSISSIVKNYNLSVSDLALLQCKIMNFSTKELEKLKNKITI